VVGAVACFAAYALLIPSFKLWGAVAATLVGFFVTLCYGFWEAQRLRRFHFEYQKLMRIALFAAAAIAGFFFVRPTGFWLQSGMAALLAVGYALSVFFGCFDKEERDSLIDMIRQQWTKRAAREAEAQATV
jgi:O-antigen/teichoic acid export membrane protein